MRRSYYNYSQSHTLSKQKNEGKFVFEIHDYQQARRTKKIGFRKKRDFIESDEVFIGNTSFSLLVHPKGGTERGNPAIFFVNNSDHDVVADLSIVATSAQRKARFLRKGADGGLTTSLKEMILREP